MSLARVVETSSQVGGTSARLEKVGRLTECLRALGPAEAPLAVAYLSGVLPQGRIGIGPSAIRAAWPGEAAADPVLALHDVDAALTAIAAESGAGSTTRRQRLLHDFLRRATHAEQDFLGRLLFGELRQGAQEGVMVDAIARAAEVPAADVRRAHMLGGDLALAAELAFREGAAALRALGLTLFRPVQPMLAASADQLADALERIGEAGLEYKLDGARIQVHRSGDDVRVYTRALNDVTAAVPDLVEHVRTLPAHELVLDGEAIALRPDGRPLPFQETMRRFGRRLDVEAQRARLPLSSFYFDVLRLDGETLLDRPARDRFDALASVVPEPLRIPRIITADSAEATAFLDAATAAGHEGVLAKALDAGYEAGRRGRGWIKVKRANTLDLVVLAAEWGHGRRTGWLSNLHLGARDPDANAFVMLGKTFKGLTDAMLEWQTRKLLELEIGREGHVVHVRPELVVEVAFNEVQASPRYPGGVALRFARIKAYRTDKRAEEADTIDAVRAINGPSSS